MKIGFLLFIQQFIFSFGYLLTKDESQIFRPTI